MLASLGSEDEAVKSVHLFLFDVDATLVETGGAGIRALESAMCAIFGIQHAARGMSCAGLTDGFIVRRLLERHGLGSGADAERILDAYVEGLVGSVRLSRDYRVLPGVRESLDYLAARSDALCGLATGNLERGARIKLERGDLWRYFAFGGFCEDAEQAGTDADDALAVRTALVRAAIGRGRELAGEGSRGRAFVIGDTPRDVASARAAGAVAVGVATGEYTGSELAAVGADLVLPDLRGPERWVEALLELDSARGGAQS
ncbi:MAG: HAD hydrolase-like protein [Deltaproteobacteria bacterium]|nr:HAD hydrolase-like protein [Deltaproteobacteria bacterium]